MEILKQTLALDRITKNTVRYDAPKSDDQFNNAPVEAIYIQKAAFKKLGDFPPTITLTVEAGE